MTSSIADLAVEAMRRRIRERRERCRSSTGSVNPVAQPCRTSPYYGEGYSPRMVLVDWQLPWLKLYQPEGACSHEAGLLEKSAGSEEPHGQHGIRCCR